MAQPNLYPKNINTDEHVKKQSADSELIGRVSKKVNSLAASMHILEERYATLRNRAQVSEENMIDMEKELSKDLKVMSGDLVDMKKQIADVREKLELISEEMSKLVEKDEFRVLEKYLDMWQPMNFVTRNELAKMVKELENRKVSNSSKADSSYSKEISEKP